MVNWLSHLNIDHVVWLDNLALCGIFISGSYECPVFSSCRTLENLVKWYVNQGSNIGITSSTCMV